MAEYATKVGELTRRTMPCAFIRCFWYAKLILDWFSILSSSSSSMIYIYIQWCTAVYLFYIYTYVTKPIEAPFQSSDPQRPKSGGRFTRPAACGPVHAVHVEVRQTKVRRAACLKIINPINPIPFAKKKKSMVTFTIHIPQMLAYKPYTDPMGRGWIDICFSGQNLFGVFQRGDEMGLSSDAT